MLACDQCSSEPFAVVTRVWDHDDQSIPASARSLLARRGGGGPQSSVQGISLSTDFAGADSGQYVYVLWFELARLGSNRRSVWDIQARQRIGVFARVVRTGVQRSSTSQCLRLWFSGHRFFVARLQCIKRGTWLVEPRRMGSRGIEG